MLCMAVLTITFSTATGTNVAADEMASVSKTCLAAIAVAKPPYTAMPVPLAVSNRDQSTESLVCDINEDAHWAAPTGSREVARPVQPALASLRTS